MHGLEPETETERRILDDSEWRRGVAWGDPRPGHPEGTIAAHVCEVLANVDELAIDAEDRRRLRLIALLHDTCKCEVDPARPRTGENHHARIARRLAERLVDDPGVLKVIELHDDAHNAWSAGRRDPRGWTRAEARARALIERLGPDLDLFERFYRADNDTGDKTPGGVKWFAGLAQSARAEPRS